MVNDKALIDKNKKSGKILPLTVKLIRELMRNTAEGAFDALDAFLFSFGSAKTLARNIGAKDRQYFSSVQSLQKNGYIQKINENQFLITPKAIKKIRTLEVIDSNWETLPWDGKWRIVVFDIPEPKKYERNTFRSVIKRKGFIGIQNSVFISPYADFNQVSLLRHELKIDKYVSFFVAKSADTDDDRHLRIKFELDK